MFKLRHALFAALFLCAGLVACGGGGGGGSSTSGGAPPVYPTAGTTPAAQQTSAAISNVGSIASGTLTATVLGAVTIAASTTSPTGVQLRRRMTDNQTPLAYFSITGSGSATVSTFAATLTLSSAPSGTVSLSQWVGGEWVGTGATVTVSGTNLSFSYAIPSGDGATPVYFALYTGTTLPTASPSPTPSASASPTVSPTASPTSAANACLQTPNPTYTGGGVSNQPSAFFSALEAAHQACVSVYTPSSQVMSAMETALSGGANLTVIFPAEEYTSESSNATTLTNDGAHVIWLQDTYEPEYIISATPSAEAIDTSYLPIHAKLALIDGIAYADGHNWFASDVVLRDQNPSDYAAIQTDLTTFPSAPPTVTGSNYVFTTDKGNSLTEEASTLTAASPGSGYTVDFISESFSDYSAYGTNPTQVFNALLAAAQAGATVNVIVEGSVTSSYEKCDLSILAYNGVNTYVQSAGGSEKMLLVLNGSSAVTAAWIGSSNMTDYDYIDWGMTIPTSNTNVTQAMQTNYSTELGEAAATPAPAASPTCSP